jgi:hypothetical protein
MDRRFLHLGPSNAAQASAAILGLALIVAACAGDSATTSPTASATGEPRTAMASTRAPASPASPASPAAESPAVAVAAADVAVGGPTPITFEEFYTRASIREGLKLSEKLLSLDGKKVEMRGYMAPPLKPELDFFVLTKVRLAFCPFCSSAAEWPDDIAVVYTPAPMKSTERAVAVQGTIEVGSKMDEETGMVSLVRIYADKVDKL